MRYKEMWIVYKQRKGVELCCSQREACYGCGLVAFRNRLGEVAALMLRHNLV